MEDLIELATKAKQPMMSGAVQLHTKITIPEGDPDLLDRLQLQGQFAIDDIEFANSSVRGKVDTLSRKGQGEPKNMDISDVDSQMTGKFGTKNATVSFSDLTFGVPGATVMLAGTYDLDSEGLDFHGQLKLKAKPSQTTTGVKSFFLKAIDPFFKGKDAGTVLAIKITGTRDNPSFGLDHGTGRASAASESSTAKGSGQ